MATELCGRARAESQHRRHIELVPTSPPVSLAPQINKDTGLYTYDTIAIGPAKALLGFRQTKSKQDNGATKSSATVNSPAGGFLYDILRHCSQAT